MEEQNNPEQSNNTMQIDPAIQFTEEKSGVETPIVNQAEVNINQSGLPMGRQPGPFAPVVSVASSVSSAPTIQPERVASQSEVASNQTTEIRYAGFWIRYVAVFIDGLVIGIPVWITYFVSAFVLISSVGIDNIKNISFLTKILVQFPGTLIAWIYYVLMTKKYGATLGKKAVGIRVVSDKSKNLTWGQVILRETIGKIISAIILYVGYILAGFTGRKQALHDKIASTTVVYNNSNKKFPVWIIVLICILPFVLVATIGILASIVLVSLSSAKGKASDAAVKSMVLSEVPAATLFEDSKGSFSGFDPNYGGLKVVECSGKLIANISPDGKEIAIFGKLCSNPEKYFCSDTESVNASSKQAEVDSSYVTSGKYSCQ